MPLREWLCRNPGWEEVSQFAPWFILGAQTHPSSGRSTVSIQPPVTTCSSWQTLVTKPQCLLHASQPRIKRDRRSCLRCQTTEITLIESSRQRQLCVGLRVLKLGSDARPLPLSRLWDMPADTSFPHQFKPEFPLQPCCTLLPFKADLQGRLWAREGCVFITRGQAFLQAPSPYCRQPAHP